MIQTTGDTSSTISVQNHTSGVKLVLEIQECRIDENNSSSKSRDNSKWYVCNASYHKWYNVRWFLEI